MIYSLGFSCFTRLSLNEFLLDHTSNPFDFVVSTKHFILSFLRSIQLDSNHNSFFEEYSNSFEWILYKMPREGTDGVLVGTKREGIYLWHAFPRIGNLTVGEWVSMAGVARDKYNFLFNRFTRRLIADQHVEKTFVISNSQYSLQDFGEFENWQLSFGIDRDFLDSINLELHRITRGNYRVIFMVRNFEEFLELSSLSDCHYAAKNHVLFAGLTPVGFSDYAQQLLREMIFPHIASVEIVDITGTYENGSRIVRIPSSLHNYCHNVVYKNNGDPWAVITCTNTGCYAIFDGKNRFSMVTEGDDLYFSNKTRWRRISSSS